MGMADSPRTDRVGAVHPIDEVDRRILELLNRDARLSSRALAREVGMSAGAISERVARLESAQVIRGYRADVDFSKLGLHLEAIVGLQTEQGTQVFRAIEQLLAVEGVHAVHIVSGPWDLIVMVRVADQFHRRAVVTEKIWNVRGFRHSETMISMDSYSSPVDWIGVDHR